jgi:hypothetical protein
MSKDTSIQCFLNHEASQGREHKEIRKWFEKARNLKREARSHLHLANCQPIVNPKENEKMAQFYFSRATELYKKIHFEIELLCATS